ncbi:MAG TPA: DUF2934 domain-containing protein [Verrucomicrobiae bacterium]|nr:DUF2934 domain-containing protein [Verrucomicrobiae bacterium]
MTPITETDPLHRDIEQYAYFLYEQRGCEPGHELEDWLEAEKQLASAVSHAAEAQEKNPAEEQSLDSPAHRHAKRPGRKA